MIENVINRLNFLIDKTPSLLIQISEDKLSEKPARNKWSKKEIIGHLVDSATNNHHRFVRAQFETNPEICYNQNEWNKCSYYQQIDSKQIILFWTVYNRQLIEIIKRIPKENLKRQIKVGDNLLSIEFLITDYVAHIEHHLKQVFDY